MLLLNGLVRLAEALHGLLKYWFWWGRPFHFPIDPLGILVDSEPKEVCDAGNRG